LWAAYQHYGDPAFALRDPRAQAPAANAAKKISPRR
jgi:hypothetical protein